MLVVRSRRRRSTRMRAWMHGACPCDPMHVYSTGIHERAENVRSDPCVGQMAGKATVTSSLTRPFIYPNLLASSNDRVFASCAHGNDPLRWPSLQAAGRAREILSEITLTEAVNRRLSSGKQTCMAQPQARRRPAASTAPGAPPASRPGSCMPRASTTGTGQARARPARRPATAPRPATAVSAARSRTGRWPLGFGRRAPAWLAVLVQGRHG